eukprot:COSAG02_NODE_23121_length_729_cov_1.619048_1_plen_55_part_00
MKKNGRYPLVSGYRFVFIEGTLLVSTRLIVFQEKIHSSMNVRGDYEFDSHFSLF